jgi:O-antigen/teichoic acid export membrane protein
MATIERDGPDSGTVVPDPSPRVQPLSLRKNFSWTFAGNFIYAGCQWGMLVVLAKLGSPEMVGQFALGLAVTTPIILLSQLQLRGLQATDARTQYVFGNYLSLRLLGTVLALAVIAAVALIGDFQPGTAAVILGVGLAKGFESVSDMFYGLLQRHERMDRVSLSLMLKGGLSLVVFTATLYLTRSVVVSVASLAAAWLVVLLAYDLRSAVVVGGKPVVRPVWDTTAMAGLAVLAFPLGIVMMLNSLNANVPRYFIQRSLGEYELGLFAAVASLVIIGTTVVGALGQSAAPRLSRHYAEGDLSAFYRLTMKLAVIAAVLGVLGVLLSAVAGRPLLRLLFSPEYAEQWRVLVWVMAGAGLWYVASVFGYAATAARRLRLQPYVFGATLAVTAAGSYLLIDGMGLYGAGLALFAGSLVGTLGFGIIILPSQLTDDKRRSTD